MSVQQSSMIGVFPPTPGPTSTTNGPTVTPSAILIRPTPNNTNLNPHTMPTQPLPMSVSSPLQSHSPLVSHRIIVRGGKSTQSSSAVSSPPMTSIPTTQMDIVQPIPSSHTRRQTSGPAFMSVNEALELEGEKMARTRPNPNPNRVTLESEKPSTIKTITPHPFALHSRTSLQHDHALPLTPVHAPATAAFIPTSHISGVIPPPLKESELQTGAIQVDEMKTTTLTMTMATTKTRTTHATPPIANSTVTVTTMAEMMPIPPTTTHLTAPQPQRPLPLQPSPTMMRDTPVDALKRGLTASPHGLGGEVSKVTVRPFADVPKDLPRVADPLEATMRQAVNATSLQQQQANMEAFESAFGMDDTQHAMTSTHPSQADGQLLLPNHQPTSSQLSPMPPSIQQHSRHPSNQVMASTQHPGLLPSVPPSLPAHSAYGNFHISLNVAPSQGFSTLSAYNDRPNGRPAAAAGVDMVHDVVMSDDIPEIDSNEFGYDEPNPLSHIHPEEASHHQALQIPAVMDEFGTTSMVMTSNDTLSPPTDVRSLPTTAATTRATYPPSAHQTQPLQPTKPILVQSPSVATPGTLTIASPSAVQHAPLTAANGVNNQADSTVDIDMTDATKQSFQEAQALLSRVFSQVANPPKPPTRHQLSLPLPGSRDGGGSVVPPSNSFYAHHPSTLPPAHHHHRRNLSDHARHIPRAIPIGLTGRHSLTPDGSLPHAPNGVIQRTSYELDSNDNSVLLDVDPRRRDRERRMLTDNRLNAHKRDHALDIDRAAANTAAAAAAAAATMAVIDIEHEDEDELPLNMIPPPDQDVDDDGRHAKIRHGRYAHLHQQPSPQSNRTQQFDAAGGTKRSPMMNGNGFPTRSPPYSSPRQDRLITNHDGTILNLTKVPQPLVLDHTFNAGGGGRNGQHHRHLSHQQQQHSKDDTPSDPAKSASLNSFSTNLRWFKYLLLLGGLRQQTSPLYRWYIRITVWGCTLLCFMNIFFMTKSYRNPLFDITLCIMHFWVSWSLEKWYVFTKSHHWRLLVSIVSQSKTGNFFTHINQVGIFGLIATGAAVALVSLGWIAPIIYDVIHRHESDQNYVFLAIHGIFMILIIVPWAAACICGSVLFHMVALAHQSDVEHFFQTVKSLLLNFADSQGSEALEETYGWLVRLHQPVRMRLRMTCAYFNGLYAFAILTSLMLIISGIIDFNDLIVHKNPTWHFIIQDAFFVGLGITAMYGSLWVTSSLTAYWLRFVQRINELPQVRREANNPYTIELSCSHSLLTASLLSSCLFFFLSTC